ncbi:MAG: peptide chain release factor 2 [Proteobacteria bacterium]|nr:peptide chain release factor 2 [Pseudomonadota bacterium]
MAEIEEQSADPELWANKEEAQKLMKRKSFLASRLGLLDKIGELLEESGVMLELAAEDDDAASSAEAEAEAEARLEEALGTIRDAEVQRMLGGENDDSNAILSINSGAGGTEAQDWAGMLFRMYMRWAERREFVTEVLEYTAGEEAGLKSATVTVAGSYAYGYLKAEMGVHRLVRISPFDSQKRRHTSFASVFVYPEVDDDIEVEIDETDLRIDTYRASGAGGQHINKTDSAIRITHNPSGIVVQCQNERSQHKNKATAMKLLKARLYDLMLKKKEEEMEVYHKEKRDIAWGSQIRSYVLQPYRMVKDHRTSVESGNVDAVLDGSIDSFIEAYLLAAEPREGQSG